MGKHPGKTGIRMGKSAFSSLAIPNASDAGGLKRWEFQALLLFWRAQPILHSGWLSWQCSLLHCMALHKSLLFFLRSRVLGPFLHTHKHSLGLLLQ